MKEVRSFCRICSAHCATRVTVDGDDRIVAVHGEKSDPLHRGYACYKGTHHHLSMYAPERLLAPLQRLPDGTRAPVDLDQAEADIAARIAAIVAQSGPDAVGIFVGNGGYPNSLNNHMRTSFLRALGSTAMFGTATIDVNAQFVLPERLGYWAAPKQSLDDSDVGLLIGSNTLVSHQNSAVLEVDPVKRLKAARRRGFKLIVIDPCRTETARNADLFVQPLPGQDAVIIAAVLRIVLAEGWHDAAFCARHVGAAGMARLAAAVEPFTAELAAERAGITPQEIRAIAEMFARHGTRGTAFTMTGINMGPQADIGAHMVELLNIVCGRFLREGEPYHRFNAMLPPVSARAEVVPPTRWQHQQEIRVRPGRRGLAGERVAAALADEILVPGPGRLRALIVFGGNPVNSIPDQLRTIEALKSLDLLVVVDPFASATARLADYVLPPRMFYERGDLPLDLYGGVFAPQAWVQYARAVVSPPPGSTLVDEWRFMWSLGRRLGLKLDYAGSPLDMDEPPTEEGLARRLCARASVSFEELANTDGPIIAEGGRPRHVQPARPEAQGNLFDVMPADVADELHALLAPPAKAPEDFLLTCRRTANLYNTEGGTRAISRRKVPFNPVYLNPQDMIRLGVERGDTVTLRAGTRAIKAVAQVDADLRPGVAALSHGWGGLPEDADEPDIQWGSINQLISATEDIQHNSMMPRMTAIPVTIAPVSEPTEARQPQVTLATPA